MAGDIMYERLDANRLRVSVRFFNKCCEDPRARCGYDAVPTLRNPQLVVWDDAGARDTLMMNQDSVVSVLPRCSRGCTQCGLKTQPADPQDDCPPEAVQPSHPDYDPKLVYDFGVQAYYLSAIIPLQNYQGSVLRFSFKKLGYNNDLTTTLGGSMYLEGWTAIDIVNTSPEFVGSGVHLAASGRDMSLPVLGMRRDRDHQGRYRDSVVYTLENPLVREGSQLIYTAPYNHRESFSYRGAGAAFNPGERRMASAPDPPHFPQLEFHPFKGLWLDPSAGLLYAHPTRQNERTVFGVQCREFRDGRWIGSVSRVIQLIVEAPRPNEAPTLSGPGFQALPGASSAEIEVCNNGRLSKEWQIRDRDHLRYSNRRPDPLRVQLRHQLPGAEVRFIPDAQNRHKGSIHLSWPLDSLDVTPGVYTILAILGDDYCQPPARRPYLIRVRVLPAPDLKVRAFLDSCHRVRLEAEAVMTHTELDSVQFSWRYGAVHRPPSTKDTIRTGERGVIKHQLQYLPWERSEQQWELHFTDARGCRQHRTGSLSLPPHPYPEILTSNRKPCAQDTFTVRVRAARLDAPPRSLSLWTDHRDTSWQVEDRAAFTPQVTAGSFTDGEMTLYARMIDPRGCPSRSRKQIPIGAPPEVNFSKARGNICADQLTSLHTDTLIADADHPTSMLQFTWHAITDGQTTQLLSRRPVLEVDTPMDVVLTLTDPDGCQGQDTFYRNEIAVLPVETQPDPLCLGDALVMTAFDNPRENRIFTWQRIQGPGDTLPLYHRTAEVRLQPRQKGEYTYLVRAFEKRDTMICRASTQFKVEVKARPQAALRRNWMDALTPLCVDSSLSMLALRSALAPGSDTSGQFMIPHHPAAIDTTRQHTPSGPRFRRSYFDSAFFGSRNRRKVPMVYHVQQNGCEASDTLLIEFRDQPDMDLEPLVVCGSGAQIDLPVPANQNWRHVWRAITGGDQLFYAHTDSAQWVSAASLKQDTTYRLALEIFDPLQGCGQRIPTTLEVRPAPVIKSMIPHELCVSSAPVPLQVGGGEHLDPSAPLQFSFVETPNGRLSSCLDDGMFDPHCAGVGQFKLRVDYQGPGPCDTHYEWPLRVLRAPRIAFDVPSTLCSNSEPVPLRAQPAGGAWFAPNGAPLPGVRDGRIDPSTLSKPVWRAHYLYEDSLRRCQALDSIQINIIQGPEASLAAMDTPCPGQPWTLRAASHPQVARWSWISSHGKRLSDDSTLVYHLDKTPSENIQLHLVASGAAQAETCPSDTLFLSVPLGRLPVLEQPYMSDSVGCSPFEPSFALHHPNTNVFWQPTPDAQPKPVSESWSHRFTHTDTASWVSFEPMVVGVHRQSGCRDTVSMGTLHVARSPQAAFNWPGGAKKEISIMNPRIPFDNRSTDLASDHRFLWRFDDRQRNDDFSMDRHPTWTYSEVDSQVMVQLIASNHYDEHVCRDTARHMFRIVPFLLAQSPTVFHPDQRSRPSNQYWYTFLAHVDQAVLHIYNRWGQEVFHSRQMLSLQDAKAQFPGITDQLPPQLRSENVPVRVTRPWDGVHLQTQRKCPPGSYIYVLETIFKGERYQYRGQFHLVR